MTELTTRTHATVARRPRSPRDPRKRLGRLLDPGTLAVIAHSPSSRVAIACGKVDGVDVIAYCTDATSMGGAIGADGARRIAGPAAGGAAYRPALTDVIVMAPEGKVFVTGPDVVRQVTGEQIDMEDTRTAGGLRRTLSLGVIDQVIDPADTRRALTLALAAAPAHRGTHGNIPL